MRLGPRVLASVVLLVGCRSVPTAPDGTDEFLTEAMRDACPTLSDEVLVAYVAAIEQLRSEEGVGEEDAIVAWAQGCESIPPNGNFSGDQELCVACVTALVDEVYR